MCDKTFGQKVKKLSERLDEADEKKGKKKKFGVVYRRKPEEVDSN